MKNDAGAAGFDGPAAAQYLAHVESALSWNSLYERPAVIRRLPDLKGKNVLDAGCAAGFFTEYALKQGAGVTALDISRAMLDKLAGRVKSDRLTVCQADLSQPLPYLRDNEFDCIICSMVMHYIEDWRGTLGEFYRVTQQGGRLVISTLHPLATYLFFKPESYFDFKLVEIPWTGKGGETLKVHYYIRPLNEVLRPIIRSGFKIISIDEPLPTEECGKLEPGTYERLTREPGLLFIVLEK